MNKRNLDNGSKLLLNKRTIVCLNQREMANLGGHDNPPTEDCLDTYILSVDICTVEMGITPGHAAAESQKI